MLDHECSGGRVCGKERIRYETIRGFRGRRERWLENRDGSVMERGMGKDMQ